MRPATRKRTSILLTCILTAALIFGAFTVIANAADVINPSGDPLGYRLKSDNTLTVLGFHTPPVDTNLVIPGVVEYEGQTYVVNEIAKKAFRGEEALKSVTIPASVTAILDQAFENCKNLSEITFEGGSQLTKIGIGAFAAEDVAGVPAAIEELRLPASLTELGEGAFHCKPVKTFILEDDSELAVIPRGFLAADGLDGRPGEGTESDSIFKRVIGEVKRFIQEFFEPTVSTPEDIAKACDSLESIYIGDGNSLELIDMGAFKNQTHLTEIYIGDGREDLVIGFGSFVAAGNNGLAASKGEEELGGIDTLILPSNLAELEFCAFDSARIKNLVFADGCGLTAIPDGFMEVGPVGNNGYPGQQRIYDEDSYKYELVFFNDPVQIAANSLETIVFGEDNNLNDIGYGAFRNQSHLSSIDFGTADPSAEPAVLLRINDGAFVGAGNNGYLVENGIDDELGSGIEELVFPPHLSRLSSSTFQLARVKNLVFSKNSKLSSIPSMFMGIIGKSNNGYPGQYSYYDEDGHFVELRFKEDLVQIGANCLETIDLGQNNCIYNIGSGAFYDQSHLTAIDFGTSDVELTIDGGAFVGAGNNGYLVENGVDDELSDGIETLVFPANLKNLYSGFELARVKNLVFSDGCKVSSLPGMFMGIIGNGSNGYPGQYRYYDDDGYFVETRFKEDLAQIGANCLETVSFGKNNSLTSIPGGSFYNQSHITSIDFGTPKSESIMLTLEAAFIGAGNNGYLVENGIDEEISPGIETLTLPANLSNMYSSTFELANVKNLVFSDGCQLSSIPNMFLGIIGYGNNGHPGQVTANDPSSFVEDKAQVCANCLETISFGKNNNISTIKSGAFFNQSHITSIDFGSSDDELTIKDGAFIGVGNNAYLVENGVDQSLGEGIELELPANLVDLKNGAFVYAGLKSLSFADGVELAKYAHGVFQDVGIVEDLVIGSDYPSDKLEGGIFSRCPELTTLDLEDSGITTIEDALKENPKLKKVVFPKTLKNITWRESPEDHWDEHDPDYTRDKICPFYGCENVEVLRFLQTDPGDFNFDEGVFQFLNEEGIVYVPEETTDEAIEDYIALLTDCGLTFAEDRWVIERYVELNGITLDPEEVELETEDVIALAVFFDPEDATEKDVVWSSSDEEVATVDENGKVTAVAAGTAEITVQSKADEDVKAVCAVTVKAKTIAVTGVSVDPAEVSLKVGKTKELTAVLEPENVTNKNVTWSSSDEEVATVDENGKVTAVAAGTAEITVKTEDGEFTAVCTVKVTKKSSGGSSSGSDDKLVSKVEVSEETENGKVTVEKDKAAEGSKVTIKVDPDEGYVVDEVTVTDKKGNKIPVTDNGDGTYTFTMPDTEVSVDASFKKKEPVSNPFADIRPSDYFYDAVLWAYENGITDGTDATHFSPSKSCSRGQMVTFLWRAAGSPEPKSGTCPFTDIDSGAYYYKAVLWAYENGITEGTSPTTFSPNGTETRAQTVTFLWRWNGKPAPKLAESSFTDIPQDTWYTEAVLWAVENGITEGTSPTTFSPDKDCTRAQIVTFLYRGMAE